MRTLKLSLLLIFATLVFTAQAIPKALYVNAEAVKAWQAGKRTVAIIDVRLPEEYAEAHIPGAINIPAQRVAVDRKKLPKNTSTPIIFYCRGVG